MNHEYFDKIDSEAKAYFLGFIYADGCIQEYGTRRQKTMTISIQVGDREVVDKLAKELGMGNNKVMVYSSPSKSTKGWKPLALLRIRSNKMCDRLIDMGCNINKTKVGMDFPLIPHELRHHFIRGFFDGDGGITVGLVQQRYERKRCYFTSSDMNFLVGIDTNIPVSYSRFENRMRKQLIYTLWIERKNEVVRLGEYLYRDATIYLNRKKVKF